MNDLKNEFSSLLEMMPSVSMSDINSLIDNIDELSTREASNLDDWIPSKNTILEILKLNVSVKDLYFCLDNFREFAQKKEWTMNDNINAKLITHIKILEQNGRISFNIQE